MNPTYLARNLSTGRNKPCQFSHYYYIDVQDQRQGLLAGNWRPDTDTELAPHAGELAGVLGNLTVCPTKKQLTSFPSSTDG